MTTMNRMDEIENELNEIAKDARFENYCYQQYKGFTKVLLLEACAGREINVKKSEKKEALLEALTIDIEYTIEVLDSRANALQQERDELRKLAAEDKRR